MKQILIVDDEPLITDALQALLREEGYHVSTANNGKVACQMAENAHFDLVILDIFMPEMDGIALITKLNSMRHPSKLIAISGGGEVLNNFNYLSYAKAMGAAYTFQKPVQSQELLTAVNDVLSEQ